MYPKGALTHHLLKQAVVALPLVGHVRSSRSGFQPLLQRGQAIKRGIMDLETLKKVNVDRISTIEETIKIQQEGRAACQNAEVELAGIEE